MSQSSLPAPTVKLDFENIQGDILLKGLPKSRETFLFFQIRDTVTFRHSLASIIHLITTTAQVQRDRTAITDYRQSGRPGRLGCSGVNIAFSQVGLNKLGIHDDLKDVSFKKGQLNQAFELGDPSQNPIVYDPAWRPEFKQTIHGVILFTGETAACIKPAIEKVEKAFKLDDGKEATIVEVLRIKGQHRPGSQRSNEHFGFQDGTSQPSVIGVDDPPLPGNPEPVRPGIILIGHEGDAQVRPAWAKDGSFLVFRQLDQLVPEFNKFVAEQAGPGVDPDLVGARLVGRWKSGTPIELSPNSDNPHFPKEELNKFVFGDTQDRCPFAAHIQKMYPRRDDFNKDERRRIIRHGIAYGPEVSETEALSKRTEHVRGLAFVCYQSSIDDGFQFVQRRWANNPLFPEKGTAPPGFDPLIGQILDGRREMTAVDSPSAGPLELPTFVSPRGGEYFLSPSIAALKTKFT